jgi:hypothetical protein
MSMENEYRELMDALALPTVGHSSRAAELIDLEHLIERYPEEARAILRRVDGGS